MAVETFFDHLQAQVQSAYSRIVNFKRSQPDMRVETDLWVD